MRKCFLSFLIILFLTSLVWGGDAFATEKKIIDEMTEVMESYISAIESSEAVETMAKAVKELAEKFEALIPKMKEIADNNPDWGDNPPEELKETMTRYMEVSKKFFMNALQKAVEYANKYQDNKALQEAFDKLNQVMSEMGGKASDNP
jgi:DNA repair ATPase RecN